MTHRHGLQTEVLVTLLAVMLTATGILFAVFLETHSERVRQLRPFTARGLLEDGRSPVALVSAEGQRWWTITPSGSVRSRGGHDAPPDAAALDLVAKVRDQRTALLQAGPPWEPIRFAMPTEKAGFVAVSVVPAAAPPAVLFGLLAAGVAVFTVCGGVLLRRRVVLPMQRRAAASRSVANGELSARVPVDHVAETAELAEAFNEMAESLETRTRELEKAVWDLRESNVQLRDARSGLDRAERLASVGHLAAGVAHEVGNPMGAMLAFLDLVRRDAGLSVESRGYLERVSREGERVRVILRQLLDFSRPARGELEPVDVTRICEEIVALVSAQRRYLNIAVSIESNEDTPLALADPTAVSQILLNLLLNAADAMAGETAHPRIRIRVEPVVMRRRATDLAPRAHGGRGRPDGVECVVEDNGPGVPAEDAERIFDAFFTSKAPGEGTGLGLANAVRLAEEFEGSLDLDAANPHEGARFVLRIPAVGERASTIAVRASD